MEKMVSVLFLFLRPRFVFFLGTPEASERTDALWMLMSSKSEKSSKKSSSLFQQKGGNFIRKRVKHILSRYTVKK